MNKEIQIRFHRDFLNAVDCILSEFGKQLLRQLAGYITSILRHNSELKFTVSVPWDIHFNVPELGFHTF